MAARPLELLLGLQRLAADAVPALVLTLVEVAVRLDLLPELLHERFVIGVGRADEAVDVTSSFGHASRKRALMRSQNAFGSRPAAFASRSIFRPCSSVPVSMNVSSPTTWWKRRSASVTTVVYAVPRCGTSLT